MKRIALVLIGLLIIAASSMAAQAIQSGGSIRGGYFRPGGDSANLIQGNGSIYGVDYLYILPGERYGIKCGFSSLSGLGDPYYLGSYGWISKWTTMVGEMSLLYFPTKGRDIYIGAGVDYQRVEVQGSIYSPPLMNESGFGFHFLGGYTVTAGFFRNTFVEMKYSTFKVGNVEAGGISLLVGYRFPMGR